MMQPWSGTLINEFTTGRSKNLPTSMSLLFISLKVIFVFRQNILSQSDGEYINYTVTIKSVNGHGKRRRNVWELHLPISKKN